MDPLVARLRTLARRLGLQRWIRYCVTGLFITASLACVWVVLARAFPALGDARPVAFGLMAAGLLVSTILAIKNRPSLVDAALQADIKLGLRERLTSSLQMAEADGPMVEALHADARRKLDGLDFRSHFPLATNRAMRWVFAPVAALALTYLFLPEFDLLQHRERVAEAKAKEESVDVHVQRIEEALKPIEDKTEAASVFADVKGDLAKLSEKMKTGELSEKQALAKLSNLSEAMQKHRDGLAKKDPRPQVVTDPEKLGLAKDLASALQKGNMSEAAQRAKELAEKMKNGELTEEQKEQLAKNMSDLSKMLGGANSELGEALAKAIAQVGEAIESGDTEALEAAMKDLELSLEDMESILKQLEQMDAVMAEMQEWENSLLGPSEYCRNCGAKLKKCENGAQCNQHDHDHSCAGVCGTCAGGGGSGPGMGGPGRGRGNQVGELPDQMTGFQPSKPGGPLTKGRMLADVLQKAAPDEDAEPTTHYVSGAFERVQQSAEQALTQQEIPRGSKEFVRQYFGSIEPEREGETGSQ